MNKNRFFHVSMIIITLILMILSMNHKIGFSKSIQDNSDKLLINSMEIRWVKMVGGLHINSKVLFAGHDDENINKLINMINNGEKLGIASNHDISYLYSKARPLGVQFKANVGEEIVIWQLFQPNSNGVGSTVSKEKVILDKYENGIEHFYIIKSKPFANFLYNGFEKIMPIVRPISATKSSIGIYAKEGDWIKISGDGCIENKVYIYISPNANPNLKYLVGKVTPIFGKWSWSTIVKKKMKTLDGAVFNIGNGYYDILTKMGTTSTGMSGIIKFDKK